MTQAITRNEAVSAIGVMAGRLQVEPKKLYESLAATVFKGASDEELLSLVVVANQYQLNPFLRQIYAFPKRGGGIVPVVGIDGWTAICNRQENFDGCDFSYDGDDNGQPLSCTCTIYVKGRSHPVKVTEYFEECTRPTEPWKVMPRRMLRHKAFMQASRLAFGLGGIYDEDEGHDIAERGDTQAVVRASRVEEVKTAAQAKPVGDVPPPPSPAQNPTKEADKGGHTAPASPSSGAGYPPAPQLDPSREGGPISGTGEGKRPANPPSHSNEGGGAATGASPSPGRPGRKPTENKCPNCGLLMAGGGCPNCGPVGAKKGAAQNASAMDSDGPTSPLAPAAAPDFPKDFPGDGLSDGGRPGAYASQSVTEVDDFAFWRTASPKATNDRINAMGDEWNIC